MGWAHFNGQVGVQQTNANGLDEFILFIISMVLNYEICTSRVMVLELVKIGGLDNVMKLMI